MSALTARFCPARVLGSALVGLTPWLPTPALGQGATRPDASSAPRAAQSRPLYPDYALARELALTGLGSGLFVAGRLVSVDVRAVPAQGFGREEIDWSVDRGVVGNGSLGAKAASDRTLGAAVVFPLVLTWATSRSGERWATLGRRSIVYAEAFLISGGLTYVGKEMLGRPRPFAYVAASERPIDSAYDASKEGTFQSMPSGHASSAWTGASLAMMEHLLSHPNARWIERAGVGVLGGAFAGATAALRVEAGQHFPSDVLAGAGIGMATGVALPLLHRGEQPMPTTKAWLQMAGGALAGTLVGVLAAQVY